jgi:hypothetical protein
MLILFDFAIALILALWVYLSLGLPYALVFILITIVVMISVQTKNHNNAKPSPWFALLLDLGGLGASILLNKVAEIAIEGISSLFKKQGELLTEDADTLKRVGEGLEESSLVTSGEKVAEQADKFADLSTNLGSYNDVFLGLDAVEITLISYVAARILFVIYIIKQNK